MKKLILTIILSLTALLLVGCNDPAPVAKIEPAGEETILTEQILTEKVITWDNVQTQTWD